MFGMADGTKIEVREPEWFSGIKPVDVLTLSPEDVWAVLPDEKKAAITREEFVDIFSRAAKRLSEVSDSYWDTIRCAADD